MSVVSISSSEVAAFLAVVLPSLRDLVPHFSALPRTYVLGYLMSPLWGWGLAGRTSGISKSKSELVESAEKLLKAMVGAIAIKDRIDGEVFHPDGAIGVCGL